MIKFKINVWYEDDTCEEVVSDHRDVRAVDEWARKRGIVAPPGRTLRESEPETWMTVIAWSALQRRRGALIEYRDWEKTVIGIDIVEAIPVDPTQRTTSAGSSSPSPSDSAATPTPSGT